MEMDWETKVWTVTLKPGAAVDSSAIRKACDLGPLWAGRIELSASGAVTLQKDALIFGKARFAVAAKSVKDEEETKRLRRVHDDLAAAVRGGHATFRLTGEFPEGKDGEMALESFEKLKPDE